MKKILVGFFAVSFVALAVAVVWMNSISKPLPVLGQIPAFELTDQNAKNFESQSLKDQVWVASFIFTSCRGVCPMMTKNMAKVHDQFLNQEGLRLVSFTVDPETDSPEMLTRFAKKMSVQDRPWSFLTGDREKIKKIMFDDFKLGFADNIMFHSDRMVLVDKNFQIRGYYEGKAKGAFRQLSEDIQKLLKERST